MKEFNTTGVCIPEKHYMVDLSQRVAEIKKLVDAGRYFTINRARQYGKTTTIAALESGLASEYDVISIDFQDVTDAVFRDESTFTKGFARILCDSRDTMGMSVPEEYYEQLLNLAHEEKSLVLNDLFRVFEKWCRGNSRSVVLIIDEVDSVTNNQVFLDFLGKLRSGYLKRAKNPGYRTFQSVILSGVTDIKHVKGRIRENGEEKENSPWNIAADFNIDMSLSETGIQQMLEEYDRDHHTQMDTAVIARSIHAYTSGYPFLVSRICQLIDEQMVPSKYPSLSEAWKEEGVDEAVKMILVEKNTLFDSLMSKLRDYALLRKQIEGILLRGESIEYLPDNKAQEHLQMYGFIVNDHNTVAVSNRIFEMRLYKYFSGERRLLEQIGNV